MQRHIIFILIIFILKNEAKIIRNSALITKMVSNFHQDNNDAETNKDTESVLIRMQIVLCKNFPTIPCDLITQDQTLKKLIEKSIQQINNKKHSFNKPLPGYRDLFPPLNNKDLSYFIQMSDTNNKHDGNKKKKITIEGNLKLHARTRKKKTQEIHKKVIKNKARATNFHNRKKMRKYYPHKVKYANKLNSRNVKEDYGNKDGEFTLSEEVTDVPMTKRQQHFAYKAEAESPPVWRIDYTKHGEPSISNTFDFDVANRFNKKILRSAPGAAVDERTGEDLLRADSFTKNNLVKTNDISNDVD